MCVCRFLPYPHSFLVVGFALSHTYFQTHYFVNIYLILPQFQHQVKIFYPPRSAEKNIITKSRQLKRNPLNSHRLSEGITRAKSAIFDVVNIVTFVQTKQSRTDEPKKHRSDIVLFRFFAQYVPTMPIALHGSLFFSFISQKSRTISRGYWIDTKPSLEIKRGFLMFSYSGFF